MTSRAVVESVVSPQRLRDAQSAAAGWARFCDCWQLPETDAAMALYLTSLLEGGANGSRLRRTLAALDLVARIEGRPAWSSQSEVARWIRGAHRIVLIGGSNQRADLLYREQVEAICEATRLPTWKQLAAAAAIAIHYETGWLAPTLCRLRWTDVRIRRSGVSLHAFDTGRRPEFVQLLPKDDSACVVRRLRELAQRREVVGEFVLGGRGTGNDEQRIREALRPSATPSRPTRRMLRSKVAHVLAPAPQQIRDIALISVTYAAALGTEEIRELRVGDIVFEKGSLRIWIARRHVAVHVPRVLGSSACPWVAWRAWRTELRTQGQLARPGYAFPQVSGTQVWPAQIGPQGLNYLVHQRCEAAALSGTYSFTSLRIGRIRSEVRRGEQSHAIAEIAGLRSLGSVVRHEERENLLSRNIAGMIGL